MTQKDKDAVIAALEEYKGDSIGLIAATIEDCQRVVREMAVDDRWIPVTERLPALQVDKCRVDDDDMISYEISDWVWGLDAKGVLRRVCFESGPLFHGWYDEHYVSHAITHWMPLPEPPKEV